MKKVDVFGINETKLDDLSLEIIEHAERIVGYLNQIDSLVLETETYFDCESAREFRKKYRNISNYFSVVKSNIIQYSADLQAVKNRMHLNEGKIQDQFADAKKQIESQNIERYEN